MIDDVLLLGVGGHAAFVGQTKDALRYFDEQLEQRPDGGINPADFFIDVISENPRRRRDGKDVLDTWEAFSRGAEKVSFDRADSTAAAALDAAAAADSSIERSSVAGRTSMFGQTLLAVKRRHPPSIAAQACLFAHRAITQQVAERFGFYFDMWLLVIIAVLVGVVVPEVPTQFQLANLIVGLTATLSGLRIFGPEYTVFRREAFQGTSVAAYFVGKIVAYVPRLAFMPLIFVLNFAAAAYPGQTLPTLYAIFFTAQLTCTALGILVSLVVAERSSQVASVIFILFSVLFNGHSPTATSLRTFPLGSAILDASYSYWTASALSLSYVQQFEPATLEQAMRQTNAVGYSNISHTYFQAQNGSMPVVVYDLLDAGVRDRITGQVYLFAKLAALSLVMALVVSARAANQLSARQLLYGCLGLVPESILVRFVTCVNAIRRKCKREL